jgi:hypothetical protein
MTHPSSLQTAYESYLASRLDEGPTRSLVGELLDAGLRQESESLRRLLDQSEEPFVLSEGAWQGRSCSIRWSPPPAPRPGDLWFDGVELTYRVFVNERPGMSPHVRGWMATRPVQVWQFRSFLRVARPISPCGDRIDLEWFADMKPLEPVVDLYPDEAERYALWFGKWSVGELELLCAEPWLTAERKHMLAPDGLLLWDLSPPSSGWNFACGFEPGTGKLVPEEFSDSDRDPRVGFATYARQSYSLESLAIKREQRP